MVGVVGGCRIRNQEGIRWEGGEKKKGTVGKSEEEIWRCNTSTSAEASKQKVWWVEFFFFWGGGTFLKVECEGNVLEAR